MEMNQLDALGKVPVLTKPVVLFLVVSSRASCAVADGREDTAKPISLLACSSDAGLIATAEIVESFRSCFVIAKRGLAQNHSLR